MSKSSEKEKITRSSGNLYADLGFKNPDIWMYKSNLAMSICETIQKKNLSQVQAAALMGIDPPKVSAIMNGHLAGFSIERLIRFLIALGQDVDIIVKEKSDARSAGPVRVFTP